MYLSTAEFSSAKDTVVLAVELVSVNHALVDPLYFAICDWFQEGLHEVARRRVEGGGGVRCEREVQR